MSEKQQQYSLCSWCEEVCVNDTLHIKQYHRAWGALFKLPFFLFDLQALGLSLNHYNTQYLHPIQRKMIISQRLLVYASGNYVMLHLITDFAVFHLKFLRSRKNKQIRCLHEIKWMWTAICFHLSTVWDITEIYSETKK